MAKYLRKECGDLNEVASGNDDEKDDDDDDDDNDDDGDDDDVVVENGTGAALTMLDRLVNLKYLSKEEGNPLVAMKDNLEKIRVLNEKQSHINDYFMLE